VGCLLRPDDPDETEGRQGDAGKNSASLVKEEERKVRSEEGSKETREHGRRDEGIRREDKKRMGKGSSLVAGEGDERHEECKSKGVETAVARTKRAQQKYQGRVSEETKRESTRRNGNEEKEKKMLEREIPLRRRETPSFLSIRQKNSWFTLSYAFSWV
jgi:hypothetical protein